MMSDICVFVVLIAVLLLVTVPFWGLGAVLWRSRGDAKQILPRSGPLIARRPLVRMTVIHENESDAPTR